MYITGMLFLFGFNTIQAQHIPVQRTHALSTPNSEFAAPALSTLDLIAVMVEFQPDSNDLTSGTGIFGPDGMSGLPYLSRQQDTRIDPLPHDRAYFEAHLEFARNYFARSSDAHLDINYRVLPQVYQLDKPMEVYAPIGETFTFEKLALFLQDVWTEVEENGGFDATGLDPETTGFVVFHAGVGRDIELTGTSLDITPFDIPSIYMRESNLETWLGSDFDGFPINGGAFRVTNSMIIPRTESRRGEDITEAEIVFPLSINGLLCASIGSHLGLPDLFNTETGEPAIGRFGLMDGAGFFSYNGLFPPEPSAWEKIYLGWENPFTISTETEGPIALPAASLNEPQSIAQYSLSSSEYFLIENRHRDPEGDGVTLTIRTPEGDLVQQTFTNEDRKFIFQESGFDTLLTAGTIVNVDNFDWSLPGGLDIGEDEQEGTADDRDLNGGMLIWHIDETVINEQLAAERVNANPQRRGVDLEEGDGAQDIGLDAGLLDNTPSFGFAFDFWWSGNDYRVITLSNSIDLNPDNIFGPDTYPDNRSNSGARSFFQFYDFSDNLPTASFRVRPVNSADLIYEPVLDVQIPGTRFYTPSDDYWDHFPLSLVTTISGTDTLLILPGSSDIMILNLEGNEVADSTRINTLSNQQPLLLDELIIAENPASAPQITMQSYSLSDLSLRWRVDIPANNAFLSSQNGSVIDADFTGQSYDTSDGSALLNQNTYDFTSEIIESGYVGITGNEVAFVNENLPDYISNATEKLFAGTINSNTGNFYYLFEDGAFTIVDPFSDEPSTLIFQEDQAEWPAIVDELHFYRINRSESSIEGFNANGALLSGNPVQSPDSIQFIGSPIIADITGDEIQDILVVGQDDYSMNIFAYESNGDPIEGFPLYVGASLGRNIQPIHPVISGNVLYAISHTGDLKAWKFTDLTTSNWPGRYGQNPFNKVSAYISIAEDQSDTFSVLNPRETYNWPNPADDLTNLRFELEEPGGTVEITIIDYTGRVIFERTVQARGGAPEEIQISTQNWGSGAYFANIKATIDGQSESKLIKIGVLH